MTKSSDPARLAVAPSVIEEANREPDRLNALQILAREIVALTELIGRLKDVLENEHVPVAEEVCLRCNRRQGEPHGRGACAASAQIELARSVINSQRKE